MSEHVIDKWLDSKLPASLEGTQFTPIEHPTLKGSPLAVQRGQGESYFLLDSKKDRWVLKKLHHRSKLDRNYLTQVAKQLPNIEGVRSGKNRLVLSQQSLKGGAGKYTCSELSQWLNNTLLIPCETGKDWASVADDIRDGTPLDKDRRIQITLSLIKLIGDLEAHQIAHRDLSSTNVFIQGSKVALIDFESVFHPSLTCPQGTTFGTEGYSAPFIYSNGNPNTKATWNSSADRFSLGILVAEILTLHQNSPLSGDGGLFEQKEILQGQSKTISEVEGLLSKISQSAGQNLRRCFSAKDYSDCPSPSDWEQSLQQPQSTPAKATKSSPPPIQATIPSLSDLESFDFDLPQQTSAPPLQSIQLPEDPWKFSTCTHCHGTGKCDSGLLFRGCKQCREWRSKNKLYGNECRVCHGKKHLVGV